MTDSVRLQPNHPAAITYRVKFPLKGLIGKPLTDIVIPSGSVIEWTSGDCTLNMTGVFWLRRRVLVAQADLFIRCEAVNTPSEQRQQLSQTSQT
jgi:hypothetical protein